MTMEPAPDTGWVKMVEIKGSPGSQVRLAGASVVLFAVMAVLLVVLGCSVSIHSEPSGQSSARAACNDWFTFASKLNGPSEEMDSRILGRAVNEARRAADDNAHYADLWRTLNAYAVIVTSGAVAPATEPTDGVAHACSTV